MTTSERASTACIVFMGLGAIAVGFLHFLEWVEHQMTVRPDRVGK